MSGPRNEGWERRLADAIEAARARPFAWGVHDCATWAADVRRAITGDDLADAWRGRYRTAAGAARLLRRLGFGSLIEAATARLGPPLPSVLMARRGDVLADPGARALGVCVGAWGLFLTPDGLTERPLADCAMAWSV